jgi:hypothetical protein
MAIVKRAPNRLAGLINQPGGISLDQAVAEADRGLEAGREASVKDALRLIDQMTALSRDGGVAQLPELYTLSNQLFGLAAAADLGILAQAAYAFCGMIDRMRGAQRWDGAMTGVYVEALRRLHGTDDGSPLADQILAGLKRVAARV